MTKLKCNFRMRLKYKADLSVFEIFLSLEREEKGSKLGPVKSDAVLPTARHRCNISSKGAVLPARNDEDMGPTNWLHAFSVIQRL